MTNFSDAISWVESGCGLRQCFASLLPQIGTADLPEGALAERPYAAIGLTFNQMKTYTKFVIALACLLAGLFTAQAQTVNTTNAVTPPAEVAPIWYTPLTNAWTVVVNSTNLAIAPFGMTLTSGEKKHTWGGGVVGIYNVTQYLGAGIGFYYLGQWCMFNGQAQLMLPLPITKNIVVTPAIIEGLGTSVAGAGDSNGSLTVLSQFAINVDVVNLGSWELGGGGFFGTVTGAGPYSGNDAGFFAKLSRGF